MILRASILTTLVLVGCGDSVSPKVSAPPHMDKLNADAFLANKARSDAYRSERDQIHEDVRRMIQEGKYAEAQKRAKPWLRHKDPELLALNEQALEPARVAREKELLHQISETASWAHSFRADNYEELERLRPGNETYAIERKKNRAAQERANAERAKKAVAADRVTRKKQGIAVGMTKTEVLESSWGRPSEINRTTTARGTREQWVYGLGV